MWGSILVILVSSMYPVFLGITCFFLYRIDSIRTTLRKHWKAILIFTVLITLFLDGFTIWHMRQENFIYYWDFSGFWRRSIEFNLTLIENPSGIFSFLYKTIMLEEYSSLPQLFLTGHTMMFGNTYPRFILAMVNSFLIPSQIGMVVFLLGLMDQYRKTESALSFLIGVLLVFFAGNMLPLTLGYVGSCGQVFIVILLLLVFNLDFSRLRLLQSILIALILITLVFLRRWYAYLVIAYFTMLPISYLISEMSHRKVDFRKFSILLINLFISGSFALLILWIGFRPLVSSFTGYDYAFAYQSARLGGLDYALEWFVNYYGLFQAILVIIGTFWGLFNEKSRWVTLFSTLSIIIIIILFYQVQVFGSHHYYIINSLVLILIGNSIFALFDQFKNIPLKVTFGGVLSFLLIVNFLSIYLQRDDKPLSRLILTFSHLSSSLYSPPRVRDDTDVLRDIATYLGEKAQPYEYVYVLAGSDIISDDILRNTFLPDNLNPIPTIEATNQLDTRDGIPKKFFVYTYIVVADPIQYHNGADYQNVIGKLAEGMLHDKELQAYYYLEKEYTLQYETNVYIYRRIEDIPENIKNKYRNIFRGIYPDYSFLYEFE